MNKILNWTFGACFRTIGRFLAIFLILALFLFIGSKLDIKLPDWLAFNVNAKTNGYWIESMYKEPELINKYSFNNNYGGYYSVIDSEFTNINFYFSNVLVSQNEYIYVPITFFTRNASYELNESSDTIYNVEASISVRALYSNGYMSSCYALEFNKNNGKILYKCNINSGGTYLNGFRIFINDNGLNSDYLEQVSYIGIGDTLDLELNSNSSIIQNQEQTNDKLDDMNQTQNDIKDSINNNDTTGAEDSASGFFDNFSSEDYGISSIITAPLRAINAMLSNTCVAPGATYKGQSFSLPCGSMLWNRPGGQDLRNFINIMYGGFLAYFVIRSLFLDIEKLKNPDSDKVEVQKL